MRQTLVLIGLLLAGLVPAVASVHTTVFDASYHLVFTDQPEGVRLDWAAGALFVTCQAKNPAATQGALAYDAAHKAAYTMAKALCRTALSNMKLTDYATVGEIVTSGLLPEEMLANSVTNLHPVVESWDSDRQCLKLLCALPLAGPNTPGEMAVRMLKIDQQTLADAGKLPVRPVGKKDLRTVAPAKQVAKAPYTGMIIDCTGLRYTPALAFKLLAPDGTEAWGTAKLNPLQVMEKGLVGYANHVKTALASGRAGQSPYIARPLGAVGPLQGNLVLRPEDLQVLQTLTADESFPINLPIVLVLDK